jgi:hypothetical protein
MPGLQIPKFQPPKKGITTSIRKQELAAARKKDAKKHSGEVQDEKRKRILAEHNEAINNAKRLANAFTPWGAVSMLMKIRPLDDWMYLLALLAAVLKDIIDIIEVGVITYVVVFIATIVISIFIWGMLKLGEMNTGRGGTERQMVKSTISMTRQAVTLIVGAGAEIIPVIDFLPIETIAVVIILLMILHDRVADAQLEKAYRQAAIPERSYKQA